MITKYSLNLLYMYYYNQEFFKSSIYYDNQVFFKPRIHYDGLEFFNPSSLIDQTLSNSDCIAFISRVFVQDVSNHCFTFYQLD